MNPLHIDVSGLGNSGKAIVSDFLSEFESIYVPRKDFEFLLIRAHGGLLNLFQDLVENWSPIRCHSAIEEFRKLARRLAARPNPLHVREISDSAGFNYEDFFTGFSKISDEFIRSLIDFDYLGVWPFEKLSMPTSQLVRTRLREKFTGLATRDSIHFCSGDGLEIKIAEYLGRLFATRVEKPTSAYVTHNAIEPYGYATAFKFLPQSKAILVVRDPRDIYANIRMGTAASVPFYKRIDARRYNICAAADVDHFIAYQKKVLSYLPNAAKHPEQVLVIDFNEFIHRYMETKIRIMNFLGIDPAHHIRERAQFDPEKSVQNVGLYHQYPEQHEIQRIKDGLCCCWDFKAEE